MRLVACPSCHAQYDVTEIAQKWLDCRCGEQIENRPLQGVDAQVHRCASCGAIVSSEKNHCGYCGSEILRDDARDLSLICPECYGRNADESRFCVGCGIAFRPEKYQPEGLEFPCPCCGCLMPARSLAGIGINECPECNGLWVPEERFDTLISKVVEAQQSADPAKLAELTSGVKRGSPTQQNRMYRKCPVCEAHMARSNFWKTSGVITDRCNPHGTWLDADELEQIAEFIMSGGRPTASGYRPRTDEDMQRSRAATSFQQELLSQEQPFQTPADRSMRSHEPDNLLGTLLKILTKVLD